MEGLDGVLEGRGWMEGRGWRVGISSMPMRFNICFWQLNSIGSIAESILETAIGTASKTFAGDYLRPRALGFGEQAEQPSYPYAMSPHVVCISSCIHSP